MLQPFQLGKLLHQLLHAEPCKLYRDLCVFTVSLTPEDHAFAAFRFLDLNFRPGRSASAPAEKLRDVVQRFAAALPDRAACRNGCSSFPRWPLVLIFIVVMTASIELIIVLAPPHP